MQGAHQFQARASAYWLICYPLLSVALLWLFVWLKTGSFEWIPIAIGVGGAAAWAFWLNRFKLDLGVDAFSYRSLLNSYVDIPYSDVRRVITSPRMALTDIALRTAFRLKDGRFLPINLKVFAKEAIRSLVERTTHEV